MLSYIRVVLRVAAVAEVRRMKCAVLSVAVVILFAHGALADTIIDTYPDWDGSVTDRWFRIAQSFTTPADNVLSDWKFALDPPVGQNTVSFEVFAWDDNVGPVGNALFSAVAAWPANGGDVLVENINLPLVTGELYGAVVDLLGYSGPSVHFQFNQNSYSDGDASWYRGGWRFLNSGWNTKFRATFVPEPTSLLSLGLGVILLMRRRGKRADKSE